MIYRDDRNSHQPSKVSDSKMLSHAHAHTHCTSQNECAGCGGFYCSYCSSTIPPQYRPANGQYTKEATEFYRTLPEFVQRCDKCDPVEKK